MSTVHSYDDTIRPINKIEFTVWGNDSIRDASALVNDTFGIELAELYDNAVPKSGGLIDTRMGPSLLNIDCTTCGFDSANCVGHFGHIDLAEPVFHMGYISWVKKILSCICIRCSKLLFKKNEDDFINIAKSKMGKQRLADVKKSTKSITYCAHPLYGCGTPVTKIKIEQKKSTGTVHIVSELHVHQVEGEGEEVKKSDKKSVIQNILTPDMCYDILKNVSDSDCILMGIDPKKTRPEDLIHKIFPVSPVAIRPSAKVDFLESQSKEDDLTHKLADIVKANNRVRKAKESSETNIKHSPDAIHLLQLQIHTNYDNESAGTLKSEQKNKTTKSICARLKGKEGRVRGNLMGKRVNFGGRTVIVSDAAISMNELRVPIKIAMKLTKPEIVTPQNIDKLNDLVKNGSDKYPGANYVFPANEEMEPIYLKFSKGKVTLHYGDIVERHIVNGDVVLLTDNQHCINYQ